MIKVRINDFLEMPFLTFLDAQSENKRLFENANWTFLDSQSENKGFSGKAIFEVFRCSK